MHLPALSIEGELPLVLESVLGFHRPGIFDKFQQEELQGKTINIFASFVPLHFTM